MSKHQTIDTAVAMEWERAKGALRAAVAGIGSLPSGDVPRMHNDERSKYEFASAEVEGFIKMMDEDEVFLL